MNLVTFLVFAATLLCGSPAWPATLNFSTSSVDASGNTGYSAAIAIGPNSVMHAAYFDMASGKVRYSSRPAGGQWTNSQIVAGASAKPYLSLALGPDGTVHLAFLSSQAPCSGQCHARLSAGSWTFSAVDNVLASYYSAIAVDPAGNPHVAYAGVDGSLEYARQVAGSWTRKSVDSSVSVFPDPSEDAGFFRRIAIALDAAGNPGIAYFNENSYEIKYARHDGTGWLPPETVSTPTWTVATLSLVLDGGGNPWVGFMTHAYASLGLATKAGGTWSVADVVPAGSAMEPDIGSAMSLDGAGRPHIAFHSDSGQQGLPNLAYARLDGASWTTQTVDEGSGGAKYAALALDASGDPHILYSDPDVGAPRLRHASATAAGFAAPVGGGPGSLVQAPLGFETVEVHYTSAVWSWTDNSSNETGFRIYGSTGDSGPHSLVATVPAGQTSYAEAGLIHGTSYYRYVAAFNSGGAAVSSRTVRFTLPAEPASIAGGPGQTVTYAAPDGAVTVVIPEGAFPGQVSLSFSVPRAYSAGDSASSSLSPTGAGVEIAAAGGVQPSKELLVTVGYSDASVAGMDENRLVLARYDAPARRWVPLKSAPEPALNRVTGRVAHLSVFRVMGTDAPSELSKIRVFPNPLRPSLGQLSMTFTDLPPGARLRLLALSGERVADLFADAAGMASWDGRNLKGDRAASGVYMVLVEAGDKRRVLKVAIQR